MRLTTELPLYFIVFCLALGAAYTWFLYYPQLKKKSAEIPEWMKWVMTVLRFLSVSLLAILLLNPLLRYVHQELEKPAIILAVDNSSSMMLTSDSAKIRKSVEASTKRIQDEFNEKFEIIPVLFGASNRIGETPDFKDPYTDFTSLFKDRDLIYTGDNLAAEIIITDGIINRGLNPVFSREASSKPFFAVAVGDTTIRKDIRIHEAKTNAITFLGNTFPVEVVVNAQKCEGESADVILKKDGVELESRRISISGKDYSQVVTFLTKATTVGAQSYSISVSVLNGERNTSNNTQQVYTEVLDDRQKIALIAHAPHPDIAALRSVILQKEQYELEVFVGNIPTIKQDDYDLIITHQFPNNGAEANFLQNAKTIGIPVWMILGTQTDITMFNRLECGISIAGHRKNFNQSLPKLKPGFNYFEIENDLSSYLDKVPPLQTPFGDYTVTNEAGILMTQRIGQVSSEMPLLSFNDVNGYRIGVLTGEGIWRWRLTDFEINESFDNIDFIVSKAIQYLSVKADKRKFRLYPSDKVFDENESINFIGEVYNESFEFTPDADVRLKIKNEAGEDFDYVLSPNNGMYRLKIGSLAPGRYTYQGSSTMNGKTEKVSGFFLVRAIEAEKVNLTAQHGWMRQIAKKSGGKVFSAGQTDQLVEAIKSLPDIQSVSHDSITVKDIIDQKWIFFLIVILLGGEWFLRRWSGGY
ncbi:MAG: hypothetical protein GC181_06810 [Bacteroidetes bacterium]|nr:hypothetical protein [Bacteroidota bacterium]